MDHEELVRIVTEMTGFTHSAGVEVVSVQEGNVQLALDRKPELLQFNDFFHGGVISGLADHAAGSAATTSFPPGKIAVTIDMHINFIAPASGSSIVASARTLQAGSSVGVVSVEVTSHEEGDETICAVATVTLRAVDMPELSE